MPLERLACSAYLPIEICEKILTVAAWIAFESDRPWLCALATAFSRAPVIVRPILYHTVCITRTNLARILATIPSGYFSHTRNLFIEQQGTEGMRALDLHAHTLTSAFAHVDHLVCNAGFSERQELISALGSPRVTHGTRFERDDWRIFTEDDSALRLRHISHLHLAIDSEVNLRGLDAALHPAIALQYVVLESLTSRWHIRRLCTRILPFFLSGAEVRRVLVCAAVDAESLSTLVDALNGYVRAHSERRIWLLDAPTDGKLLSLFRPGISFDEQQCMAGRPICPASSLTK